MVDDREFLDEPALRHVGADGRLAAFAASAISFCAVGIVDRDDRDCGLRGRSGRSGLPQIGGAGAPVDVDARIDRDQSGAAPFLDQAGQRRIAEARHHDDVAADQVLHLLDRADAAAEQRRDVAIIAAQRPRVGLQRHQPCRCGRPAPTATRTAAWRGRSRRRR